ncbi:PxKF domain-containing protein [Pseudarthrobacter sp. NKDBFgelt]|uniref:PxKF domain-containing protein n=1 Tax=Pseudarthrobacter sp. NKDBFgelt TaxID=3384443 RepID=UPI0038D38F36
MLAGSGIAWADDIHNTLDTDIDAVAEVMALNAGGTSGSTTLAVETQNGDGKNGCNLTGSSTLTLQLTSSNPAVAVVSPSTVTFGACGETKNLTISPVGAGSATVTATEISNTTTGTFNLAPATFRVDVAAPAPANTAPLMSLDGPAAGGSYQKGSVPDAVCKVTDVEDGPSTFDALLSAISGQDGASGVGTQTAFCGYTDKGGLTVASSVNYAITDGTAPRVSYTLTPYNPDGLSGWYKSAVRLDWIVEEDDSTSTLSTAGCESQSITADQEPAEYSCAATSGGGTADAVRVTLKKDGTEPLVGYTEVETGTLGKNGWFTSDVTARFTATDATSGLLKTTGTATSSGEGADIAVLSPEFTDIAGNAATEGAASKLFKIDKTAPKVTYVGASPAAGTDGWYNTDVIATFEGTDVHSGLAVATREVESIGEGEVVVESPVFEDLAGNATPAGADSATFKIDKTAPSVTFDSVILDGYFGSTPVAPTCTASDGLSGVSGGCSVTGYGSGVGTHTLKATATDVAGNTTTVTQSYTVKAWELKGFSQPVDMNDVLNTVKGGSTVPAKFEIFAGDRELTDLSAVSSLKAVQIQCSLQYIDDIELTTTGNTSLRYDAVAGQFVYNWKTPAGAGSCYKLTMTAKDGTSISANFKLK